MGEKKKIKKKIFPWLKTNKSKQNKCSGNLFSLHGILHTKQNSSLYLDEINNC